VSKLSFGRRLFFAFVSTMLVLLGAEIVSRVVEFALPRLPHLSGEYSSNDPKFFLDDPNVGYRLRPGGKGIYCSRTGERLPYAIDSRGLRSPALLTTAPLDLLCLGDSCTFGEGLACMDDSYPDRVRCALEKELGRKVVVAVGGVPGYTSRNVRQWLEGGLSSLRPRVVVVWVGWNDGWWHWEDPARRAATVRQLKLERIESRLVHFAAFRLFRRAFAPLLQRYRIARRSSHMREWRPLISTERFSENLAAVARLARKRGAHPILMTLPCAARSAEEVPYWMVRDTIIPDGQTLLELNRDYNAAIREVCRKDKIELVDLAQRAKGKPQKELFTDPSIDAVHPSAAGHEWVSAALLPSLRSVLR